MTDDADLDRQVAAVAARLAGAGRLAVLTGAGVSAASGVPTFRGPDGLWRQHRPEALATPEAFAHDPRLVWEWYDWRRQRIAACVPNPAHDVLARWQARWPTFTLITQNVDGLHERAGSTGAIRLHGSIWDVRCSARCARGREPRRLDDVPLQTLPPQCPHCEALDRPDVVWFGEPLDAQLLRRASVAASTCEVLLVVGTSAVVYPAAGLIPDAKQAGAFVAEINPDETPASAAVDVSLRMPAEVALSAIDHRLGLAGVRRSPAPV